MNFTDHKALIININTYIICIIIPLRIFIKNKLFSFKVKFLLTLRMNPP